MAQETQDQASRAVNIRSEYSKLCNEHDWTASDPRCLKAWMKHLDALKLSKGEYAFRLECAKKEIRFVKGMPDDTPIPTPE